MKQPFRRNRWDFVEPGTVRGDVLPHKPLLGREHVTELRDNPDGFDRGPLEVTRALPGIRAALRVSGSPFEFTVRVILGPDATPQVVDLRMRSPVSMGDVPITNADLKSISVAALAACAINPEIPGAEFFHELEPDASAAQVNQPTKLTDEFLRDVTRLAREAWACDFPNINKFVAGQMYEDGKVGKLVTENTVKLWLKKARARRRQSPNDNSFLLTGELRGRPGKGTG